MNNYIRDFLTAKVEDHCFTSHMHLIYSEVFTWFFCTCYAFFYCLFLKSIYLAALGLSCSRWDLLLCCVDSLVVARGLSGCGTGQAVCHGGLVAPFQGMRYLSSGSGIEPTSACIARWILNHWTTSEVLILCFLNRRTYLPLKRGIRIYLAETKRCSYFLQSKKSSFLLLLLQTICTFPGYHLSHCTT